MRPEISAWPGATFYGGALQDGPNTRAPGYGTSRVRLPQGLPHYAFIDTSAASSVPPSSGGKHGSLYREQQGGGGGSNSSSWSNPGEAELVVRLVRLLERSCQAGTSVGLISPYSAQVRSWRRQAVAADEGPRQALWV
jgi:superfamily I DNA and/or RNA helicase